MSRGSGWFLLGAAVVVVGCGVPEQKYKAAVDELQKSMHTIEEERRRADVVEKRAAEESVRAEVNDQRSREAVARAEAAEARAAELSNRLTQLEQAVSAASADAARQREMAAELTKTRELLLAEKAAASAEADRQRQLASRLEQEKSALQARSREYESLATSLDQEIKAGRIQISELQGKVTVRMAEKVLFPSGSATISADGKAALVKVADAFKTVTGRIIRVEGHTDNVPIRTDRFPSNWELSAARAIAVVRYLQERGVDPNLLGAAGYAEYQPIAFNDTPEGRAQNRRIEISLAAPPAALPTARP
jgi:chemotaxis protein MotB